MDNVKDLDFSDLELNTDYMSMSDEDMSFLEVKDKKGNLPFCRFFRHGMVEYLKQKESGLNEMDWLVRNIRALGMARVWLEKSIYFNFLKSKNVTDLILEEWLREAEII